MARLGLAVLLAGLLGMVGAATAETRADPWAGAWTGNGEDNRGDKFEATVRIYEDGSARIAYQGVLNEQSYQCSGVLLPLQGKGRIRLYLEKIVFGTCLDLAEIRLTRKGDAAIVWDWKGAEEGKPVTASATLAPVTQ